MDDKLKPKPIHLDIPKIPDTVDFIGYDSPIDLYFKELSMKHEEALEGMILRAVNETGININRERLIAVLEGDRKSYADGYRKGYADGVREAKKALDEETKALFDEWSAKVLSRFAYDRDFAGEVDNDES